MVAPTAAEKYGYGNMEVGQVVSVVESRGKQLVLVRAGLSAFGRYYNQSFKTWTHDGVLYIKRMV